MTRPYIKRGKKAPVDINKLQAFLRSQPPDL